MNSIHSERNSSESLEGVVGEAQIKNIALPEGMILGLESYVFVGNLSFFLGAVGTELLYAALLEPKYSWLMPIGMLSYAYLPALSSSEPAIKNLHLTTVAGTALGIITYIVLSNLL